MNRKQIIDRLLKEGFSDRTLANFTDRQLHTLSNRVLAEQDGGVEHIPQDDKSSIDTAKKNKKKFVTYEEEEEVSEEKSLKTESVKGWVKRLAENKFAPTASKKEIVNLIQRKINEQETLAPMPKTKAKKGHNGIPEFLTYDAIAAQPETKPDTSPAPTVEPGTKEPPRENPRRAPFRPKHPERPLVTPKPKAKLASVNESNKKAVTPVKDKNKAVKKQK